MNKNLYQAANETSNIVTSIPAEKVLESIGIFPGAKVTKKMTYGFGRPVFIEIGSRKVAIGKKIAQNILVEEYIND